MQQELPCPFANISHPYERHACEAPLAWHRDVNSHNAAAPAVKLFCVDLHAGAVERHVSAERFSFATRARRICREDLCGRCSPCELECLQDGTLSLDDGEVGVHT